MSGKPFSCPPSGLTLVRRAPPPLSLVRRAPPLALLALLGVVPAHAAPPTALLPPAVPESVEPAQPAQELQYEARFDTALSVRTDLLLEGVEAGAEVDFPLPGEWDLLEDPVLTLAFAHSAALLPDRSHLTLSLNGTSVGSVALEPGNETGGRLAVSLPRDLLAPYNHLRIRAVQHYGGSCEDPFDPGLWTRISKQSAITMRYKRAPVRPDLTQLPFPLFDATGFGPAHMTLVLAQRPSPATLDALGTLAVSFGRMADYRGVEVADTVDSVAKAKTHALLVGLLGETPEIRQLVGSAPPPPGQGLVALVPNPADPTRAVLVVTGADAQGLERAALAVSSEDRRTLLAGASARVSTVTDGKPPASRRDPKPAPDTATFDLAALGLSDQTVRGFYTSPVSVPIELGGDSALRPGGSSATIHYAYASGLDGGRSAMEIRLDGVSLKSVALDDPAGSTGSTVQVPLPDGLVTPRSRLDVAFTLFPKDFDACRFVSDRTLWATVFADSTLTLERDRLGSLPDLARLRYGAWPFTLDPQDGGVVIALPDAPTAADAGAGFALAAALGRWSTTPTPSLRLVPAGATPFSAAPDANFVLLGGAAPHALRAALAAEGALALTPGPDRTLTEAGQRAVVVSVPETEGIVEEVLHPANPTRAALVLTTARGQDPRDLVAAITDPARVANLSGNAALIGEGGARSLTTLAPRQVGSLPIGTAVQLALRRNWIMLGVALVMGALLLVRVKRAWTRAHEEAE